MRRLQLDDVGIIHMNGRIYDLMLGHFMWPDPSGLSFWSDISRDVIQDWHGIWRNPVARAAIIVVGAYFTGGAALNSGEQGKRKNRTLRFFYLSYFLSLL